MAHCFLPSGELRRRGEACRLRWDIIHAIPADLPMFSKSKAGESYRDLQRRLAEGRGYWLPIGLRGPGWNARQGWPGQPVKVDGEWDDSVSRLAELCEKQGIPLFFLLTPVRKRLQIRKGLLRSRDVDERTCGTVIA